MGEEKPKRKFGFWGGVAIGILALIAAIMIIAIATHHHTESGEGPQSLDAQMAGQTRTIQQTEHLFNGEYALNAGQYSAVSFKVSPRMLNPRVEGNFSAFGGAGNDIEALLINKRDFSNWANRHSVPVYYSTPGQETTGQVNAALPPGTYMFIFSNAFSQVSRKQVTAQIDLIYTQTE